MSGGQTRGAVAAALLLLLVSGCAPGLSDTPADPAATGPGSSAAPPDSASPSATPTDAHTVAAPGPLRDPLLPADLLVYSQNTLSQDMVEQIRGIHGVTATEVLSLAQVSIENRVITVAAVDPSTYRRYTRRESAQVRAVWTRVSEGRLAITPALSRRLKVSRGSLQLGNDRDAPVVQIGAIAKQIPRVDAVVNEAWGPELGMRMDNALLISTGLVIAPQSVRPDIERIVGGDASVQILGPDLDISVQQTAFLTGGSAAAAVGTFSYRVLDRGRIAPEASWVAANIRTERVPILGAVTCHRVVLPQLRAALTEVVARGLADKIHPEEYAGCYYPRFIAGTTQLSLHSFGIALDLNVPGNRRGTVGEIDRTVVSIFKKWGFTWGGDWGYTDPMHFEMNRIVRPG